MVKIQIDNIKCPDATICLQCLRECPEGVLMTYPGPNSKDYGLTPKSVPKSRRIVGVYTSLCTACMKCVEICPKQAIVVR